MWVYKKNYNNSSRFLLGQPGENTLICIGINPSTAEPENLDNTLMNVKNISIKKGYDGWIMLNVYPQRATNPNELHQKINQSLHQDNIRVISNYLENINISDVWASWGNLINIRPYLKSCLKDIYKTINAYNPNWLVLGNLTKEGHPHHPLFINHKSYFNTIDMENYIRNLNTKVR